MMHGWNTDGGVPLTLRLFVVWSKRSQRSWLREGNLGKDVSGDLMKSELESVHGGWESWIHLSWAAKKGFTPMVDKSMVTLLQSAPHPKLEPVRPDPTAPAQPGTKSPLQALCCTNRRVGDWSRIT
jgi:hypothetical protein